MSRTAIIGANLQKSLWDKASAWAAYTKNRIPHKSLNNRTPIELFLNKDPIEARTNLRPFGQRAICYDYEIQASDKLAARSWEGRLIGYTSTHGTYQVLTPTGASKIVKDPRPIQPTQPIQKSDNESESEDSEPEDRETEEPPRPITPEKQISTTEPPAAPKRKRKPDEYWDNLLGHRSSTRERKPTAKVQAVGTDLDHPTDEQARNSPLAAEWAKARAKERAQLENPAVGRCCRLPTG